MKQCSICKKQLGFFSRKFICTWCGLTFCAECVVEVHPSDYDLELLSMLGYHSPDYSYTKFMNYLCPTCEKKFNNVIKQLEKAKINADNVELVSENYEGKKSVTGTPHHLETFCYEEKKDSREVLKILAAFYDDDIVLDVSFDYVEEEEETEKGGTYYYKKWYCTGTSYKKSKKK